MRLRLIARSQTLQVKDLSIEGRGAARENFAQLVLPRSTARVSGLLRLAANDAPQIIDLAGIFELSQQPIDAAQWRAPPAQPVADVADAVASSAITQTDGAAPLGNAVAPSVAGAKTMDPVVAQQDWPTVARRVKAKVVDQTEALKALGFPAGDGSNYLQARMCLQAALDHLEPTPTLLTDILTQPLRSGRRRVVTWLSGSIVIIVVAPFLR